MSYKIPRHKVFISYYHRDDQYYKNKLINMQEYNDDSQKYQSIFDDYSVHENEIDDTGKTSERIRQIIRDDYIQGATVLILLCGQNTRTRKHIDWELHAAMFHTDNNPKLGILVINLPTINQICRSGQSSEKELISPNSSWTSFKSRKEYEEAYLHMPIRIIDNFESGIVDDSIVPISVVDWDRVSNNSKVLKRLIDNAFSRSRKDSLHYNYSRVLRGRNS